MNVPKLKIKYLVAKGFTILICLLCKGSNFNWRKMVQMWLLKTKIFSRSLMIFVIIEPNFGLVEVILVIFEKSKAVEELKSD